MKGEKDLCINFEMSLIIMRIVCDMPTLIVA